MSTAENVQAWSTTAANNASADANINWAEGQDPASVNNSARSMMAAITKWKNDTGGNLTAGGSANALTVTTGEVLINAQLASGLRVCLKAASTNTSATVTFAPDGLTAQNIKRADGSALAVGSIQAGMFLDLVYNSGTTEWWAANIPPIAVSSSTGQATGYLFGLTLSNDSGGTTAIAIAAGSARDATDVDTLVLSSALTGKVLANSWTVGNAGGFLDTGSVGNNTYHVYLIKRTDTGVVDGIASLSASAPTLPSNYTEYRRIGSIIRTAGAIRLFQQNGDRFRWKSSSFQDISTTNPGTSAVTASVTVPQGIVVHADIAVAVETLTGQIYGLVTSLDETDRAASVTDFNASGFPATGDAAGTLNTSGAMSIKTDTSGRFRYRLSFSDSSTVMRINTFGWVDTRGRLF